MRNFFVSFAKYGSDYVKMHDLHIIFLVCLILCKTYKKVLRGGFSHGRVAFTLIEMIVAITIFTIFIGFSISSYLNFHRVNQEILVSRTVTMEAQAVMNDVSDAIQNSRIDYDFYSSASSGGFSAISLPDLGDFAGLDGRHVLNEESLALWNSDATEQTLYAWDSEAEQLTVQKLDAEGNALEGYEEPLLVHSDALRVTYAHFRIFPDVNPYDLEQRSEDEVQYQPIVILDLTFAMPGRIHEEVSLDLHTAVTSRLYQ